MWFPCCCVFVMPWLVDGVRGPVADCNTCLAALQPGSPKDDSTWHHGLCPVAHFCWHTTSQYLKPYLVEISVCRQNICASRLMSSLAVRSLGHPRRPMPPSLELMTHALLAVQWKCRLLPKKWMLHATNGWLALFNTIPWTCSTSRVVCVTKPTSRKWRSTAWW